MKLPEGSLIKLDVQEFAGLIRPKSYVKVSLENKKKGLAFSQFILVHPALYRLRLWLALWRCKWIYKKHERFVANNS